MRIAGYFRERFKSELPLWRLSPLQLLLLSVWSTWPWLVLAAAPNAVLLAFAPVAPLMPFGYLGGSALAALAPGVQAAYATGFSVSAFSIGYLAVVSWRQRRGSMK